MIPQSIIKIIESSRPDIDQIFWDQAKQTGDGYSVPAFTFDIDGLGPHSGNMTIETYPLDYWVGDWQAMNHNHNLNFIENTGI